MKRIYLSGPMTGLPELNFPPLRRNDRQPARRRPHRPTPPSSTLAAVPGTTACAATSPL